VEGQSPRTTCWWIFNLGRPAKFAAADDRMTVEGRELKPE
jgi:hypothetical protein